MAINNQPTIQPRTVTGIFTRYIAKTLPLAFDESMSYYECLCALLEYLNETIVPDINNTNEGLSELQEFYLQLQTYVNDYFDNLDVQDAINNKLDEMVESGELEQIIEQYLNSKAVFCFDTIADLKAATNLIDGSEVRLLGNTSYNDGVNQMFLITTRTVDDVDGVNDTIIINENLVAKRIKEKDNLPLKPNITSNEEIKNLHMVNENTNAGEAGILFDGQENVTISHSNIEGGYWSARIGNENDDNTTKNIKLINNKLTSSHGISLRHKRSTDIELNGEHTLLLNEVNNTQSNPGIESWAENINILFNKVKNISGSVGGTGGITVGGRYYNIIDGNRINNYTYGVELGNSKLNIVSNCIIKNCTKGIICSSSPTSDIIIDNCIVISPTGGRGIEFAGSSAERIKVSNCIFMFGDSLHDFNAENSHSGIGIYATSGGKSVTFENCSFINYNEVQCYGGSKYMNCHFYNNNIIYVNRDSSFTNCIFKDSKISCTANAEGLYPSFNSCTFIISEGVTLYGNRVLNGESSGIIRLNNCNAINCNYLSQVSNASAGNNDIRFGIQFIDGIGYTYNRAELSNVKTIATNAGYTLREGTKIIDVYNKKVWITQTDNRQISYESAVPSSGAFVKGDRIYNNFASSSTVDYWLCTKTGEFGTDTEPVFVAKNV